MEVELREDSEFRLIDMITQNPSDCYARELD